MYAEEVQGIIALCLGKKGWRGGGAALSSALSMGHMRLEGHRPPTWLPIPDNCLVVSAEGLANLRMAGGAGLGTRLRTPKKIKQIRTDCFASSIFFQNVRHCIFTV
jgi:hypothetical protein